MRLFSILDNLNSSVQSFWVGADVVRNQRRDIHVKCNPGWFAGFNASNSLRFRVRADALCAPSATPFDQNIVLSGVIWPNQQVTPATPVVGINSK